MLKIKSLSKSYKFPVIQNLDLDIKKGEFVCILGHNACGKTTLLKSIAGLTDYMGTIQKESKNIAYISQDPNEMLLPWLSVSHNLVFPSRMHKCDKNKMDSVLNLTNLSGNAHSFPYELSGGMAQLLLIGRALMNCADILLMDEPFRSLDIRMARDMQLQILEMWEESKVTVVMVSHNIDEAIMLADRIVILSDRPSTIKNIFEVDLPRPRHSIKKYVHLKEEITNALLT